MSADTLRNLVDAYVALRQVPQDARSQVDIFQAKREITNHMMRNNSENLYVFATTPNLESQRVIVVRFDHVSENVFINIRKVD